MTAEEINHTAKRGEQVQNSVDMSNTCSLEADQVVLKCRKDSENNALESMRTVGSQEDMISQREFQIEPYSRWRLLSRLELPEWLRGNPFLSHYHRPPMASFGSCFKSIFKIHNETGNIWTHLLGFIAFVSITLYMFLRPISSSSPFPKDWQEKLVFGSFFTCGILCLGFSWIFHTVHCHSKTVSKIFRSLDYSGIVMFIMGFIRIVNSGRLRPGDYSFMEKSL